MAPTLKKLSRISIKKNPKMVKILANSAILSRVKVVCEVSESRGFINLAGEDAALIGETIKYLAENFSSMPSIEEFDAACAKIRDNYTPKKNEGVQTKSEEQKRYVNLILENHIVICHGPAGTGKTHIAVVMAVEALLKGNTNRIVITRPVVEAGERLGFLPGGLKEKIDPYLYPIYDQMQLSMSQSVMQSLIEKGKIEVAPLAYMRGRTFRNCWIIADEAQNMSPQQVKMLLTRIGTSSKIILTGDSSQSDIDKCSGLTDAIQRLKGIKGIEVIELSSIVRHDLIAKIIKAYEK